MALSNEESRKAFIRGHVSEYLAVLYLLFRGYRILAMRFRPKAGEIDVIARKADLVVFVEVKARRITGDALFNVLGVRWPLRTFCTDFPMTQRTAHVLGEVSYDVAAFTHGPEITDGARERVRRFLSRAPAQ